MTASISVIIPVLNEQRAICAAIRSAWEAGAAEVIVVDGGSHDETAQVAALCQAHVMRSPPGRAIQQNAGARQARGQILLFQHADCRLSADSLRQVRQEFTRHPRAVAGAFRQQIDQSGWIYRLLAWGNAARVRWWGLAYGDQGICVRREIFDRLGGFAEVPLMEDVILMRQLRRLGPVLLLPGPLHVSARRWTRYGVLRQTARNWCLLTAFRCGVSPTRLQRFYPRHDQPAAGRGGSSQPS